jgi:hypothetical protein
VKRLVGGRSRQAVQERISDPEHIAYVLRRVEEEIAKRRTDLPDTLKSQGGRADRRAAPAGELPPPVEWVRERLSNVQSVPEQRTARSAQMLRNLLGPIELELQTPDIGRPFYRAVTTLDALALVVEPPPAGAEGGSNTLRKVETAGIEPASAVA